MDSHARSITKTITWRVIGTLLTGMVAYLFTGVVLASIELTLVVAVVSTFVYYLHERVWNNIAWGRL